MALLPNDITTQFEKVIAGLPVAKPYGATTLPADLPTPLRDALERVTTAGKINLNSDGSATFGAFTNSDDLSNGEGTGKTNIYNAGGSAEVRISKNDTGDALGTYVRTNIFDAAGKAQSLVIGNENNINLATGAVDADGAHTIELNADGSATFAGDVTVNSYGDGCVCICQWWSFICRRFCIN